jgi:hypothetical protein
MTSWPNVANVRSCFGVGFFFGRWIDGARRLLDDWPSAKAQSTLRISFARFLTVIDRGACRAKTRNIGRWFPIDDRHRRACCLAGEMDFQRVPRTMVRMIELA